ncbi:MAG: hypothetical protein WJ306_01465 [Ferrovum myxofaciens]
MDVLQRVGQHPARDIGQLTPRCWKAHSQTTPALRSVSLSPSTAIRNPSRSSILDDRSMPGSILPEYNAAGLPLTQ